MEAGTEDCRHDGGTRPGVALDRSVDAGKEELRAAAEHGFPLLPSGCAVHLDAVASLRRSLGAGLRRLADELSELSAAQPAGAPPLDLTGYLRESGRELGEVYKRRVHDGRAIVQVTPRGHLLASAARSVPRMHRRERSDGGTGQGRARPR